MLPIHFKMPISKNKKWQVLCYVTPLRRIREQKVSAHLLVYSFMFFKLLLRLELGLGLGLGEQLLYFYITSNVTW